jgi:hypothetical protein
LGFLITLQHILISQQALEQHGLASVVGFSEFGYPGMGVNKAGTGGGFKWHGCWQASRQAGLHHHCFVSLPIHQTSSGHPDSCLYDNTFISPSIQQHSRRADYPETFLQYHAV